MSAFSRLLPVYASRFQKKKLSAPYDVFLCFRGSDTRNSLADFLYKGLLAAGVSVFRDEDSLSFGEQMEKELLQTVRTCRIAIPIISQQFVESRWCNQELTEMMNCRREHGKSVFPIFYKVNYVDMGCQRGKFGEDLCRLAMQYSLEEVQKWREALTSVARIRGWTSQTIANGHEADLVEMVVAKVLSELKTMWIKQLPSFISSGRDIESSLADYLKVSLQVAGIRVFSNDDPSLIGKDIAHEIHIAINQCKICIPIVSENFDSSYGFLEGLAQMVECKTNGQKILPIFYKVEPSQVRRISLLQHKDLDGGSTYGQWEQALRELESYRGWASENIANGNEGVLVKQVVKVVSSLLNDP